MSNVEGLIEETGGCGLFQILHVISTHSCRIIGIWGLNMMSFGNYDPGWECIPYTNTSLDSSLHPTPSKGNCSSISHCQHLKFKLDGKTIVTEWDLVCNKTWIPSLIIALQMVGQLIGSIIAGHVGENMGRKVSLYGHTLLYAVSNLIAAFSTSWEMFATLRLFIGIGIGGIISGAFIYTMEFLNPRWRGIVGGMPINNAFLAIFSLVVYLEQDWRWVQVTTAIIAFVALFSYFWISESMRWLVIHGKKDKAKKIVRRIARYNRTPVPNMDVIDEIQSSDTEQNSKKYSYADLFKNPVIRNLNIKLAFIWILDVMSYYTLTFSVKALPGNFYFNFFIFCASEVPAVSLTGFVVNCVGRVKSGAAYFGFSTLACGIAGVVALCNVSGKYNLVIVFMAMASKASIAGGRSIMRLCTGELMPTSIRALSFSFHLFISRIGGIMAPFLVAGHLIPLRISLCVVAVLLFISSVIFITLPESKDIAMSDLIESEEDNVDIKEEKPFEKSKSMDLSLNNNLKNENKRLLPPYTKMYTNET